MVKHTHSESLCWLIFMKTASYSLFKKNYWIHWSSNFWTIIIIIIIIIYFLNHNFIFQKNNSIKLKAEDVKRIWAHSFDTIGNPFISGFFMEVVL
jgi:hypothetical protein